MTKRRGGSAASPKAEKWAQGAATKKRRPKAPKLKGSVPGGQPERSTLLHFGRFFDARWPSQKRRKDVRRSNLRMLRPARKWSLVGTFPEPGCVRFGSRRQIPRGHLAQRFYMDLEATVRSAFGGVPSFKSGPACNCTCPGPIEERARFGCAHVHVRMC